MFVSAGEYSGDLIGASLIDEIKSLVPDAEFVGVAGPAMRRAGCLSLVDIEDLNVMGFHQVLCKLPAILQHRRRVIRHCRQHQPSLFIGIDNTEFNLSLAVRLKAMGIMTIQYKGPSIWAWRPGRIKQVERGVDRLFTLFPFEQAAYNKSPVCAHYVGHPLADRIPLHVDKQQAKLDINLPLDKTVVALMPGSRRQEVESFAPILIDTAFEIHQQNSDMLFVTAPVDRQMAHLWDRIQDNCSKSVPITSFMGQSSQVLAAADYGVLTSGTVTLEALLYRVPMLVLYRVGRIYQWLLRRLLMVPYISLPNLLAGDELVPECLQERAQSSVMAPLLQQLMHDRLRTQTMIERFEHIHRQLRCSGLQNMARIIVDDLTHE